MHSYATRGGSRVSHSALALYLLALTLVGCRQATPSPEPSAVGDEALVSYLRQQIDVTSPQDAPRASYQDYVPSSDYEAQREHLWSLWRRANERRLGESDWALNAPRALVWELPGGERMQLHLFAKGTKPEGGYPFFINLHGGGRYPNEPGPWTSVII